MITIHVTQKNIFAVRSCDNHLPAIHNGDLWIARSTGQSLHADIRPGADPRVSVGGCAYAGAARLKSQLDAMIKRSAVQAEEDADALAQAALDVRRCGNTA